MLHRSFSALIDSLVGNRHRRSSSSIRTRRLFKARWEPLEDRHLMASSITIVPGEAGSGDQDANLMADGQVLFADPDIGANTLSAGAFAAIAPDVDVTVQADGDITIQAPINLSGARTLSLHAGGGIVDGTPGEQADIVVVRGLALRAGSGIGAADDLDVTTRELAFQNAAGAVNLESTGALTIKAVDGLASSSNLGTTTMITASGLLIGANVTTRGDTVYTAPDAGVAVDLGIAVEVTDGNLTFEAGGSDLIILARESTVQASGAITLNADFAGSKGRGAILQGILDAGVGVPQVIATAANTRLTIGLNWDARLPDGLAFQAGGTGILEVNDRGGTESRTFDVNETGVTIDGADSISFTGVSVLDIIGSKKPDTFNVAPLVTTKVLAKGDAPMAAPGDALNLDLTGVTSPAHSGTTYTFGNRAPVFYDAVETLSHPPPDLKITTHANRTSVTPGGSVTYTMDYVNDGDLFTAHDVRLEEVLPPGTTFDAAASTPGWSQTGNPRLVILYVGHLPPGATGAATFSLRVDRPYPDDRTSLLNSVTIRQLPSSADANMADNTATERTQLIDVPLVAVGADAGGEARVRVFHNDGMTEKFNILPYAPFTGGVRVALGDLTGDGRPEIITAPGRGMGAHVRVFRGVSAEPLPGMFNDFLAFPANYQGGANVSSGDINGDGRDDIIVTPDAGYLPQVRIFSGLDGSLIGEFLAFESEWTGGVSVAVGDVNADGRDDIITGTGRGGGPQVRVFSGEDGTRLASFFAFDSKFTGGVRVASANMNDDGRDDVVVGAGPGGGPQVRIFSGDDFTRLSSHFAFANTFRGGVTVAGAWHGMQGDALRLADDSAPPRGSLQSATDDDLNLIRAAAISHWEAAGEAPERLHDVDFQFADLAGNLLGMVRGNTVLIDRDAAGRGWSVSADDGVQPGRVDLLTVVLHELGHELGLDHETVLPDSLMTDHLAAGVRRLPIEVPAALRGGAGSI